MYKNSQLRFPFSFVRLASSLQLLAPFGISHANRGQSDTVLQILHTTLPLVFVLRGIRRQKKMEIFLGNARCINVQKVSPFRDLFSTTDKPSLCFQPYEA
ncbi:hypothetical protein AVEN_67058-1 [Araneus ventricosus]|uniref:Uncharacterized protein n=1 Tax=Araneus ventricosus TaxID=182803 RepID=A0A4Y2KBZ3_ARAVE|nr:hypothetical protein AVEN_67058-1 [Araneus ventricosus]